MVKYSLKDFQKEFNNIQEYVKCQGSAYVGSIFLDRLKKCLADLRIKLEKLTNETHKRKKT